MIGIRATIPKGPVTLDLIKTVVRPVYDHHAGYKEVRACKQVPFGNELRLAVANGTIIKAMLEHSVKADEPVGSFLVTDGLRFWWDPTAKPYSRVVKVEVRVTNGEHEVATAAPHTHRHPHTQTHTHTQTQTQRQKPVFSSFADARAFLYSWRSSAS